VSRAQYEAALKKCGGAGLAGGGSPIRSPVIKEALVKFTACMRAHGVNVPPPNTSGNGPIFSTQGLNTASATFKAAEVKCSGGLRSTLRRRPGT
jgi:hypothetical protein